MIGSLKLGYVGITHRNSLTLLTWVSTYVLAHLQAWDRIFRQYEKPMDIIYKYLQMVYGNPSTLRNET